MKNKSKGIFGKSIDIMYENGCGINISFVSHQEPRLNIIRKENKSSDITGEDNKELTSLLSDIKSHLKKAGVSLTITQNDTEKNTTVTTGQHPGKAALSDAEIALQKMQFRAQELGAELVLTDRPAEMANERWRLPGVSGQENRSESMTAAEGLAKLAVAVQAVTDQCPLQITLMIQPDSRPQVMLNVSAGEVNWIFAAKEGRYPLKDLLAKMAGKTITHGWDAVVVYQRGQANTLLKQQHIKRFITGNVLAPLNEDIASSDATRLQTHNLTLSAPHLSFDAAGTGDSMAQVGWDFVKGMIVFKQEADDGSYRVKKIEKITPLNSPFIAMKVPLSRAPGSVSGIGEVQFDIKEGDHFTNNLVVNDIEQDTISGFFKRRFEATPDDQRIYKLGTISNYEHEQFQPEMFEIRTMGAPNTASRGSQDEGDGAVVLFVQMKGSDSEPGRTEADWLLADNYTSALVIGNKHLLDSVNTTNDDPKAQIKLGKYSINNNSLWGLKPIYSTCHAESNFEGEIPFPGTGVLTQYDMQYRHKIELFDSPDVITPYSIKPSYTGDDNNQFENIYRTIVKDDSVIVSIYTKGENNEKYSTTYRVDEKLNLKLNAKYVSDIDDSEGTPGVIVSRVINDNDTIAEFYDIEVEYVFGSDVLDINKVKEFITNILNETVSEALKKAINILLSSISLRYVNTLVIKNILFPGQNYFHSEYAFIPGDLLVQGQLIPGSESFTVTPTEINIVAGSEYQFRTTPEVSGVKWSISDSEKGNTDADLGHIDAATGKYTAPQAGTITEGVRHVVVCAEKGDTKVYALASVLAHSVNISPAYQVIAPGKSSTLTANSLNGGDLTWTLADNPQDSTLTKVSNNEYTYTAGKRNKKLKLNLERISVTDETGTTTEAMILVRNVPLTGYLRVSYDNVPENSVQLTYFPDPDDTETAIPADEIEWTVLESGGATLDPETGILSCSQPADNSFAVISTKYLDEDEGALYCVIAIPLPLNTYKETILAAYSPEQ
ncbi:hypothetical protein [Morganella morganii]|uniref:hypothetical protein n=1 Tax=Morganella morganii TaxID=582 RepID=UPI001BD91BDF|nr:hypothetical protein [Morganella morganii]ELT0454159.1 hypothetical protein [Morganella morganii]MBT0338107.1 hypothetical protein [Morganella morganii subsp. morganii]